MSPQKQNQNITVNITTLAHGGEFIGTVIEGPAHTIGKKALVPFVAPGEKVSATIIKEQARIINATPVEIENPSSERQTPPCQYFGTCGGCDLQHIKIYKQREEKLKLVIDTLKHHAGVSADKVELIGKNLPDRNYRQRILLHLDSSGRLGFYKKGTGDVVELSSCLLAENVTA
jgi:23S rRNA (uracil1939-C5)-methyltransferase